MKYKLPPSREDKARELIAELAELLAPDIERVSRGTGKRTAQCLASLLRPMINQELSNAGSLAVVDRRQRLWKVKCRFGYNSGVMELCDDGEFEWETVRGFDEVEDTVRACFDDFNEPHDTTSKDYIVFDEKNMRQRFGGLYPTISRGGGKAATRIYYEIEGGEDYFLNVRIERAEEEAPQKDLDLEEINPDSPKPAINRLRAMREARGQS